MDEYVLDLENKVDHIKAGKDHDTKLKNIINRYNKLQSDLVKKETESAVAKRKNPEIFRKPSLLTVIKQKVRRK